MCNPRVIIAFLVAVSTARAAVTVQSWTLNTQAGDFVDGPGEMDATDSTVALPFNFTRTVQSDASSSISEYAFQTTPSGATFHFEFDHVRDGDGPPGGIGRGDFAYSAGSIAFTIAEAKYYDIDGFYDLMGQPNGMSLFVSLIRMPTQETIYDSEQSGAGVVDQHFIVGGLSGSNFNNLMGSPSGGLQSGSYLFSYQYTIRAVTSDSGASATGMLEFLITPEPGTFLPVFLAATAIALQRRTRRRRDRDMPILNHRSQHHESLSNRPLGLDPVPFLRHQMFSQMFNQLRLSSRLQPNQTAHLILPRASSAGALILCSSWTPREASVNCQTSGINCAVSFGSLKVDPEAICAWA
jgi:hypothetical protein